MKVIAVGDPHFKTDNIPEVNLFVDRLEKLAKDEKPDLIVILGDVLHTHERLHTIPLNSACDFINRMRNIAETIILVGNHDMCFARNTPILLRNGTVKYSQNICVGDILIGDDNFPRTVLSTKTGKAKMYTVKQHNSSSYTVSESHLLCLKNKNGNTVEISVKDYLSFGRGLQGYKISGKTFPIEIVESDKTEFFGWETDGNHRFLLSDLTVVHNCNNQQFLTENHWMNALKDWSNVTVVDKVIKKNISGFDLVFCPYVPPGRFEEALNTVENWKNANCIFAHQEFFGCKMAAIVSVEGDKWPENYPQIVSGHIHGNQTVKNIYYPGSSMQHAFGESEHNVIPILTFSKDKEKYDLKEIDLDLPRKKIIYSDVSSMEEFKIAESKDKVKISLTGNYEEFKAFKKTKKYRDIVKNGTKVIFKPKKIKKEDQDKEKANAEPVNETDFLSILSSLIISEKNSHLYQVYELLINGKDTQEDDFVFLD